jgi:hypothetical protein
MNWGFIPQKKTFLIVMLPRSYAGFGAYPNIYKKTVIKM